MQSTNPIIPRSLKKDGEAIKLPILIPLFASILLLLIIFTMAIYRLQQKHINDDVQARLDSVSRYFNQFLASDARLIGETTHFVKDNPDIQNAWLAKNRNTLLTLTTPIFEKLRRDYRITHLYFIDTNNTCFLRVHNPTRFGDRINRFTLKSAANTVKPYWGIELGSYGTFTLRVVQPWFVNNTLTGFIEFGEEIDHISPQLKDTINVDLAFLIDKSLLNRDDWQKGLKMMGRTGDWDLMPNCVIADSTISDVPPEFTKLACLPHEEHQNHILTAKLDGSTFSAGFVKLSDAAGHEVGDILVIKNITKEQASLQMLLAIVATLSFLIASVLISFFYTHIAGIEKHLFEAHTALIIEIEKRKKAETDLRRHRDDLEDIVIIRTGELQHTNTKLIGENAERKKAEEALRVERENLKSIFASVPVGMLLLDEKTMIVDANTVIASMVLKDPGQVIGQRTGGALGCIHSLENEKGCGFAQACPECSLRKGILEVLTYETSVHGAEIQPTLLISGQQRRPWLSISAEPIILNGRKHIIVAVDNITKSKRTEETSQKEMDFSQAVIDCLPGLFYLFDDKGRFLRTNKNFEKISGYSADELSRMTPLDLFGETDKRNLADAIQQVFKTGEATVEADFLSKDQTKTPYFFTGKLFQFDQKSCLIGMGIDITDRKRAHQCQAQLLEQLEKTNRHLQQEIAQRTEAEESLAKANDDLQFTVAQLSRTNKQLNEFAHLTAHDLKTPLRGIGTLAQWLCTDYYDKLDDNGRQQINMLVKRVERMDNLVNAILQYSTIARNKPKERKVDLNVLTKEIIDRIRPPENIKITINNTLPVLICEEEHLWQIFRNLISNAVKFSDKPQASIIIDVEDEKHFWKFSVADNGPGIESQHFERIFQLFQMLDKNDDVECEGIGLTLTKKIVELYDGKIWLTSKLGEGSTFFFTLQKQMTAVSKSPQPA